MIWRALGNWALAGCLSASAINFSHPEPKISTPVLSTETMQPEAKADSSPKTSASSVEKPSPSSSAIPLPSVTSIAVETSDASSETEYRIQPEDVLQIAVYEEKDLSTKARVSGSGEVNFPLLGRIPVAGQTVLQVQEKVEELLGKDYLINPQVQVFILSYHARNVYLTGAVDNPGSYSLPLGKPTTLMEAIAMAGGFRQDAAVSKVRIIRIEKGKEKTLRVNTNDVIKKGDKTKDVEVLPNDVIFVPESFF